MTPRMPTFPVTRHSAALLTFLFGVLIASPCAAAWHRIDSPNFVVVGDVSPGALREVAVKFEGFRETLSRVLSDRATGTAVPTIVIVFPSDRAFTPFKPKYNGKAIELAGLFVPGSDVNYIALSGTGDEHAFRTIFHEYAHLIISNVARNIPVWLNEGLAEYYSTYEVSRGGREAVIGSPIAHHILRLNEQRLLPLDELLNVEHDSALYNEGDRRSVFYAQSWALTHLLLLGEPRRTTHLASYLTRLGQGIPARDAWQQSFGAEAMDRELSKYVGRTVFKMVRYTFPEKLATFDGKPRPLSAIDADAFLADFLMQQRRTDEAADRLAKGTKAGATSQWATTVAALIGTERKDAAGSEKRLLGLGEVSDWLTAYRAGAGLADLARERGEAVTPELLGAARTLFAAARGSRSEAPNAIARLASLELQRGEQPSLEVRAAVERARTGAPGRLDYVFLHAQILARQSEFAAARAVLAPLMSPAYPQEMRDTARRLMGYIVQVESAAASASRPAQPTAASVADAAPAAATEPLRPDVPAAPSAFRPDFRELQPGEQRVEGILERIECTRTGAVFHVRAPAEVIRLTAPRMDEVDFITYRDDLTGRISCGPLKEPAHVYVTWRSGEASVKRAVAIEFLPK